MTERMTFILAFTVAATLGILGGALAKRRGSGGAPPLVRIPDARGRKRRPSPLPLRVPHGIDPERWSRIHRGIALSILLPVVNGLTIWAITLIAIGRPLLTREEPPFGSGGWEPTPAALFALPWLAICCLPIIPLYRLRRVALLTEARMCPWCVYDLRGIPTTEHARTTCPECSGEWDLPPAPTTPWSPR